MKVLGVTTTREVYIGSKEKNFRNNEFLIVKIQFKAILLEKLLIQKLLTDLFLLILEGIL
ncbi:hypothetical protein [Peptoniphilus porci]|uniref:hypothetical protein n=1 Tax=Peptoniphilus porci TaxID=2652280 RepID=UPI001F35070C|nr:hypothetical protein [Peptoniphilus porci]